MKTALIAASLVAVAVATPAAAQIVHESPFVCDLSKLTAAGRTRLQEVGRLLAAQQPEVRELPDGYAFVFRGDPATFTLVAEWITAERLCCPFFDIQIRTAPEGGPITVTLGGRPETKEFARLEFGALMNR